MSLELFSPRDSLEGHLIKLKDDGHIENYKANDSIDWTSDDPLEITANGKNCTVSTHGNMIKFALFLIGILRLRLLLIEYVIVHGAMLSIYPKLLRTYVKFAK